MVTSTELVGLVLEGERAMASDGGSFEVVDPSSGKAIAQVAKATAADVDRAVRSARATFESSAWRALAPAERGRILTRIAHQIRAQAEQLAELESQDTGKPLKQARADVQVSARYFEFYAGVADKIMGSTIPLGPDYLDFTVREPIGVSGQIVPWNYPLQISSRGVAPALAAGCTVVLKPAHEAPLAALRLGELALECGLPRGALNVVPGTGPEAGAALASHPDINQLTFTGSVDVGILVAKAAAENIVPAVLELGGKCPNVAFADCDLDLAAAGIAGAIFQNAGQTCSAGSRLLVERGAHAPLLERLTARAKAVQLGPGLSDPDMGPIITERQLQTVEEYVEIGRREGARVVTGGARPADARLSGGYFFEPTLLDDVEPGMRVAQEEIFGPVLAIMPFDSLDDASAIANGSPYGLIAGVWTRDINKAMSLAQRIKAGQIYVNTYGAAGGVELPFGGYKKSGYGREKGLEALASYTQVKNVCIRIHRA